MKTLFMFIIFSSLVMNAFPQSEGYLVIIGGGDRTENIMNKIVELSGGTEAEVLIIPNASSYPEEAIKYAKEDFEKAGCTNVNYLIADSQNVNDDETIRNLENTKCIFFSGGDQSKLTSVLLNTKLLERIKKIYSSGGVISGTSAGAAVMSKIMITGDELLNKDSTTAFNTIMKGNIKFTEGFGFFENVIVDQHFIKRKRNNRLISLVLEHPENLGIGIDESTAVVVYPADIIEAIGESQVVIYDATNAGFIETNTENTFSISDMKMHILTSGQKFNLSNKVFVR